MHLKVPRDLRHTDWGYYHLRLLKLSIAYHLPYNSPRPLVSVPFPGSKRPCFPFTATQKGMHSELYGILVSRLCILLHSRDAFTPPVNSKNIIHFAIIAPSINCHTVFPARLFPLVRNGEIEQPLHGTDLFHVQRRLRASRDRTMYPCDFHASGALRLACGLRVGTMLCAHVNEDEFFLGTLRGRRLDYE
ncbi:uncharacterized protein BT62DRAFT_1006983 [Guyanagaster necrorhizus]|uniref:Uncharacterized protein n=1 Tax=Guyanagaster necrorhizus TaxID=856835 RepID=A0A9P8ARM9_9AGAR|nr:uncharacterized protein BT62DRAFT_1006983 [Guyanagaster necrorhizus MCA 3950]KAG7445280.1 hypothetical protein BT62DRAFT_1006983 [Guyanagaster necrorhizus MCA 3950]